MSILPEMARVPLEGKVTGLKKKKESLEAAAEGESLTRPYQDAIKTLEAQIGETTAKLASIGQPESFRVLAEASANAKKEITKLNEELEKKHTRLSGDQERTIHAVEEMKALGAAELAWSTAMETTRVQVTDRIAALNLMTAAIGRGYEATKQASVEARVMTEMKEKYNDAAFAADRETLRQQFATEYEAQHREETAASVDQLKEQIEMEKAMARVEYQGAEAVRRAALEVRIARMEAKGASKEQIQLERDLYAARKENASGEEQKRVTDEIRMTRALAEAQLAGAEATRKAGLEQQYLRMGEAGMSPDAIARQRSADNLKHAQEVTAEALKTGMQYELQLESIEEQIARLKEIQAVRKNTWEIELSIRDLENQRLHTLAQQTLAMRGARDGLRAFFLEMQEEGKSAAQVVYEALKSALDRTNDELSKLLTGQKTNFAAMLQEQGQGLVKQGLELAERKGLAWLGGKLGIKATKRREGQTAEDSLYVTMTNSGEGRSGEATWEGAEATVSGAADRGGGGLGEFFKWLLEGAGAAGGGGGETVIPKLGPGIAYAAEGGVMTPGNAYVVGERGPEPVFATSHASVMSNALAKRYFGGSGGGGPVAYYSVDARGTDPVLSDMNTRRALQAVHGSAVATGVLATHDRQRRVPPHPRS